MSWDAYLTDDRGHHEGDWNYTHNTNRMIAAALVAHGEPEPPLRDPDHLIDQIIGPPWYARLDGLSGDEGKTYLALVIEALGADPGRFRAMNPPNGWGDYDRLLTVLRDMHDRVPTRPCTWSVNG